VIEQVKPEVVLVTCTEDRMVPAKAARLCTSTKTVAEILEPFEGDEGIIEKVMGYGHQSISEHFSVTFGVSGISRVTETQLVRHRVGSTYSVKSGRYTKVGENFKVVIPEKIKGKSSLVGIPSEDWPSLDIVLGVDDLINICHEAYLDLLAQGVPPEDARYILPQATATQLLVTMNARQLLHFFGERCCSKAQWEFREAANQMLQICLELHPVLFKNAGPKCLALGFCPEQKSCGLRPPKQV